MVRCRWRTLRMCPLWRGGWRVWRVRRARRAGEGQPERLDDAEPAAPAAGFAGCFESAQSAELVGHAEPLPQGCEAPAQVVLHVFYTLVRRFLQTDVPLQHRPPSVVAVAYPPAPELFETSKTLSGHPSAGSASQVTKAVEERRNAPRIDSKAQPPGR